MTNSFIKKTVLFAVIIAVSVSCKKSFLETTPKGKLIAKNIADYNLLLNATGLINLSTDSHIILSDDAAAADPDFSVAGTTTQRLFRWEDEVYDYGVSGSEMGATLQNIYVYNKVINEVGSAPDGTDEQKESLRAEARACRAFTNFLLINLFGKPYKESTAATDPGFPIVTGADVTATGFTRGSVKDTYDFIVKDLTESMPNLPVRVVHRMRMSRAAGEALLGKVYMFMGKFDLALPLLNSAFTDLANSDVLLKLYDYNVTLGPGGSFLPVGAYGPTFPAANEFTETLYLKQTFSNFYLSFNELVLRPEAVALFTASDLRLKMFSPFPNSSTTPYPAGMLRRVGPLNAPLGLTVAELYLLRAECKARLNDLPGATTDVETLRKSRMSTTDAAVPVLTATQQLPLIKFILDERIREFALQGFRWFDTRRLSVDPLFPDFNYTHNVYSTSGAITSFTLKRDRLVLRFPTFLMEQNPGMINNP